MSHDRSAVVRVLLLVLVSVAAAWWLYSGIAGRSISTDDGISVLVARSIGRRGWPVLPSGLIYNRAYLAHYLLAGSLFVFGRTDLALVLPAWGGGIGTLLLLGHAGRRMFDRPWVGLGAAAIVSASGWQAWYAASPRMYELLGFFSTWTVVAAWRGLVRGEPRQHAIAWWAAALGLQCERGAGLVMAAVLAAAWAVEPGSALARVRQIAARGASRPALGAGVVAFVASAALAVVKPAGALRPIVVEGGNMPEFFAFSLRWERVAEHLACVDALAPCLLVAIGWATVVAVRGSTGLRFLVLTFWAALLPLIALTAMQGERIVLFLLPTAALAVAAAIAEVLRSWRDKRVLLMGAGAVFAGVGLRELVLREALTPKERSAHLIGSWVIPDVRREGREATEVLLRRFAVEIDEHDVVLSSNPWTTDYYLPRTDGLVRQRIVKHRDFTTFDEPRDEYFGIDIVDSLDELDARVAAAPTGARVWLIRDFKADAFWGPEFSAGVEARFEEHDHAPGVRILLARRPAPT